MSDGRPLPGARTERIEGTPTVSRTLVIVGAVVALVAAVVAVLLWGISGSTASVVVARALSAVLVVPLLLLLISVVSRPGLRGPSERLSGWAYPEIEVTPWPVALGSTVSVSYTRRAIGSRARNRLTSSPPLEFALVCREWVEYTVGTDTRTAAEEVVRIQGVEHTSPLDNGLRADHVNGLRADHVNGLRADHVVIVPLDAGAPTMKLRNNRIEWYLEHRLGHPFGRRTETRADLHVAPALDARAINGEGTGYGAPG